MIMDGALEQLKGKFHKKCREVDSCVKQLKPYTPWLNAAKSAIRELKRGFGWQMVWSGAPKCLWDHCLECEAYIRSHTAHDICSLNGQVPETLVSGETADISPFSLFKWYEWVMFCDTSVPFPDNQMVLGCDLGPAIDIGPAMTCKIIKENGHIVYRSTVRHLTPNEWKDADMMTWHCDFDQKVQQLLGESFDFNVLKTDPDFADI